MTNTTERPPISLDDLETHYYQMGLRLVIASYTTTIQYGGGGKPWLVADIRHVVPIPGRVQFVMEHDGFWGSGQPYKSEVVEDVTWDDIMKLAEEMILVTGDHHHSFLEGVETMSRYGCMVDIDGVKTVNFIMGS